MNKTFRLQCYLEVEVPDDTREDDWPTPMQMLTDEIQELLTDGEYFDTEGPTEWITG